jgi:hypothetical protein
VPLVAWRSNDGSGGRDAFASARRLAPCSDRGAGSQLLGSVEASSARSGLTRGGRCRRPRAPTGGEFSAPIAVIARRAEPTRRPVSGAKSSISARASSRCGRRQCQRLAGRRSLSTTSFFFDARGACVGRSSFACRIGEARADNWIGDLGQVLFKGDERVVEAFGPLASSLRSSFEDRALSHGVEEKIAFHPDTFRPQCRPHGPLKDPSRRASRQHHRTGQIRLRLGRQRRCGSLFRQSPGCCGVRTHHSSWSRDVPASRRRPRNSAYPASPFGRALELSFEPSMGRNLPIFLPGFVRMFTRRSRQEGPRARPGRLGKEFTMATFVQL